MIVIAGLLGVLVLVLVAGADVAFGVLWGLLRIGVCVGVAGIALVVALSWDVAWTVIGLAITLGAWWAVRQRVAEEAVETRREDTELLRSRSERIRYAGLDAVARAVDITSARR